MTLVKITEADSLLLTDIMTASFDADTALCFGEGAKGGPPGYNTGELGDKIVTHCEMTTYLIKQESEIIGFISLVIAAREVAYFCIIPKYMGKGFGSNAWREVEKKHGKIGWWLETPSYSHRNHYFYEKLGFSKREERVYPNHAVSYVYYSPYQEPLTFEGMEDLILNDKKMRTILTYVASLELRDSWVCAGILRNYLWNVLSGHPGFDTSVDVDVIFYDPNISYEETVLMEEELLKQQPEYQWELKNQAYMHGHNPNTQAYQNAKESISKFPERCTAIAMRLSDNEVDIYCPYGLEDIQAFVVRPTSYFLEDEERMAIFDDRVRKKDWLNKWPQLRVERDVKE